MKKGIIIFFIALTLFFVGGLGSDAKAQDATINSFTITNVGVRGNGDIILDYSLSVTANVSTCPPIILAGDEASFGYSIRNGPGSIIPFFTEELDFGHFTPSPTDGQTYTASGRVNYDPGSKTSDDFYAHVGCGTEKGLTGDFVLPGVTAVISNAVTVVFVVSEYACLDSDDIWRCFGDSDSTCGGGSVCVSNCGQIFPDACNLSRIAAIKLPAPINVGFELTNPIGQTSIIGVIDAIAGWIFTIAIPIVVIVIIYAGIKLILARGNDQEVSKAKDMLKWALIGLAIVLIGRGFVELVTSILNLSP